MEFIWLSNLNKFEKEWRDMALSMIKHGLIKSGTRLSQLLVNFVFVVSDGDEDAITNIFGLLRDALERKIDEGHRQLVVFDRIFALLETGEKEIRERVKSKKLKGKASPKDGESGQIHLITPKEFFVYILVGRFCWQIVELQALLSALLEGPLSLETIKARIGRCKEDMDAIEYEIYRYSTTVLPLVEGDSRAENEFLQNKMELKIRQLWIGQELVE